MREIAIIVTVGWLIGCGWIAAAWLGPQTDCVIVVAAVLTAAAWTACRKSVPPSRGAGGRRDAI